jgi:hypothetical protein
MLLRVEEKINWDFFLDPKVIFIIRILPEANKPYYLKKLGPEETQAA